MNFKNLFNNRNKSFVRLTEAGDYLGRRLRENLTVYEIDDANGKVTYISERNHLISCEYKEVKGKLTFANFVTENLDKIMSDDCVDTLVEGRVSDFVQSLVSDRYDKAEASFDSVLDAFTMRAKIEESRKKLHKRSERFGETYNIKETKSYKKFVEALPLLQNFLEENKEELSKNQKLVEGLRLSKVVGDTYDLPKLTLENLGDEYIVIPSNSKKTLYEMVCEKELVRKELIEARESFNQVWASSDAISTLASHIYSTDGVLKSAIRETVKEVPYLALSNKIDLIALMESVFEVTNPGTLTQKDIKEFVNKIYEFKKPLKTQVLDHLNETYGVNIQSLKFIPSFKGLAEVQSEVLGMMAESMEEGILCDVLKEFSQTLQKKGGVQVLDVANTMSDVMQEAKFDVVDIRENFDMKKLGDYLADGINEAQYYGDDDKMSDTGGNESDDECDDCKKKPCVCKDKKDDKKKKKLSKKQQKLDVDGDGEIEGEDLAKLRKEGVAEAEAETEVESEQEVQAAEEEVQAAAEESEAEQAEMAADEAQDKDFRDLVSDIEKAIKDIDFDLEDDDDPDEEEVEED
jgi:hypothetical protein